MALQYNQSSQSRLFWPTALMVTVWTVLKLPAGSSWSWSASVQYQCDYSHLLASSKPCSSFALVLELQIQGVFVHGTLPNQPMSHVWHELWAVCRKVGNKTSGRICRCSGLFTALCQSWNTHWSYKSTLSRVPAWETACQIAGAAHVVVSVHRV